MTELATEQGSVELFGILKRLPEVATRYGNVGVNELLDEHFSSEGIVSLFDFVREDLEITDEQFLVARSALFAEYPDRIVVGFVRGADGLKIVGSRRKRNMLRRGTLILSGPFEQESIPIIVERVRFQ